MITEAKATNYGVVRLELIEHLYEKMYDQRRHLGRDERQWPHRIMGGRRILSVEEGSDGLQVEVCSSPPGEDDVTDGTAREGEVEVFTVDLMISATGYRRTAHLEMLKDTWHLLPGSDGAPGPMADKWHVQADGSKDPASSTRVLEVGRDYAVRFNKGAVAPGSGVWLQGCCEDTHGVSRNIPAGECRVILTLCYS